MGSALEAAIMAAEVGTKAIKDGDVSEGKLAEYEKMWRDKRGEEFQKILRVRHFVEKMNDKQFDILAELVLKNELNPELFVDLSHGEGLVKLAKTSPSGSGMGMRTTLRERPLETWMLASRAAFRSRIAAFVG